MIIIVGGPSGCGKSTIGSAVAEKLHYRFIEGDSLHPQSNVDKMSAGIPLTDDDRWGWLQTVADDAKNGNCVVSCSALKKSYRDFLLQRLSSAVIVIILPPRDVLVARMNTRKGHFMKANMLESQLATLEVPTKDEAKAAVVIPHSLEETAQEVIDAANSMYIN